MGHIEELRNSAEIAAITEEPLPPQQDNKLYEMAAKRLVRTFSELSDLTGTGSDSWRIASRFRAKRERRKLRERARQDDDCEGQVRPSKDIVLPTDGEDANSIQGHVLEMQRELQKPRPNMTYVEDSMARTLATRRPWVTVDHPTVAAIVDKYPALRHGTFVQQEFTEVTGKTIEDRLMSGQVNSSLRVLEAARGKRDLAGFFQDFDKISLR
ncbi:hypothetical protein HPB47_015511 [Ixodes persulcatus]|uniref:Uncharacterized protein n=1 Tax=Ixodes persulcatus TaxID=34615 RepID=A0AC60QTD0_IXOPE|nr:hypothetical protein HPB47_015511 [Ixodes persulcatus]